MPSNYLSRVALDTDTELPKTGVVPNVTTGHVDKFMNAAGAVQTLEAALGIVGSGGSANPTNPGDILICTAAGATVWRQPAVVNAQSGASYTLALTDAGQVVECSAACTVTVPPNSSVAFAVGTTIAVTRTGTGAVTLAAGGGVTIQTPATLSLRAQYSTVLLRKRATDTWLVSGDVASGDLLVVKTANESVTSNATLQDDDHLFLSVEANATYELAGFIVYDGATTGDIEFGWTVPTGATLDWTPRGPAPGATNLSASTLNSYRTATDTGQMGAIGTGTTNRVVACPTGLLVVSSTAGTLQFRWAQDVSDATATTVIAGSYLRLRRLA